MKPQIYTPVKDPFFRTIDDAISSFSPLNPFDEPVPPCLWLDGRDPDSSLDAFGVDWNPAGGRRA